MSRWPQILAACLVLAALAAPAAGQEIPLLRMLLERALVAEMVVHDSRDTAWYHEKSVDRQKYTSGKLLGKKIRLASWTEQSKTWFWLADPDRSLDLQLERLAVVDARCEFAVRAVAHARFNVWGRIPKLVRGSASGSAKIRFHIEGSTAIGNGGLADARITRFDGRLDDLQFNNDLAHPFEDLVKDALNDYVRDKNAKLRTSVEKAINRVRF